MSREDRKREESALMRARENKGEGETKGSDKRVKRSEENALVVGDASS